MLAAWQSLTVRGRNSSSGSFLALDWNPGLQGGATLTCCLGQEEPCLFRITLRHRHPNTGREGVVTESDLHLRRLQESIPAQRSTVLGPPRDAEPATPTCTHRSPGAQTGPRGPRPHARDQSRGESAPRVAAPPPGFYMIISPQL